MKVSDLTEEKVAELKQKHGENLDSYQLPDDNVIVVSPPSDFVFSRWLRDATSDKDRAKAMELLALSCIVVPDQIEAKAALKKYPAAILKLVDIVTELGGGGGESKKL